MSYLNNSYKNIIEDHFENLPEWVNKEIFYKNISEQIDEAIQEARENGEPTVDLIWILGAPLVSNHVDIGAGGGLDGHCDSDYFTYAIDKECNFIEDCFICGRPIKGDATYIHDEAHCRKCSD